MRLAYAVKKDRDNQPVMMCRIINRPSDAVPSLMAILGEEPAEVFGVLCLTTKHRVIAYHEVSRGTLESTLVHPREVFTGAVLAHAAALIACHVHPSGDPAPSAADLGITKNLVAAGEILGIAVLDHIIIGDNRYYSFREMGQI